MASLSHSSSVDSNIIFQRGLSSRASLMVTPNTPRHGSHLQRGPNYSSSCSSSGMALATHGAGGGVRRVYRALLCTSVLVAGCIIVFYASNMSGSTSTASLGERSDLFTKVEQLRSDRAISRGQRTVDASPPIIFDHSPSSTAQSASSSEASPVSSHPTTESALPPQKKAEMGPALTDAPQHDAVTTSTSGMPREGDSNDTTAGVHNSNSTLRDLAGLCDAMRRAMVGLVQRQLKEEGEAQHEDDPSSSSNTSVNIINLRDIASIKVTVDCGAHEGLVADTKDPMSDCGLLQKEYGMCRAIASHGQDDTQLVATPYAQGYITVKGLEDPVAALAAMVDEHRRIERGEALRWPIAGVHATVEGDGDEVPFSENSASSSAENHYFRARPFVMDVVYTEVDFAEPSFQADRFAYRAVVADNQRPPGGGDARVRASAVLPTVWRALASSPIGDAVLKDDNASFVSLLKGLRADSAQQLKAFNPLRVSSPSDDIPLSLHAHNMATADRANRFRNFNELRYSLRAIYRYIIRPMEAHTEGTGADRNSRPSLGKIYIIVSHKAQAPPWMQAHDLIVLVEHRDLFPDPAKSVPNFNSMSIESVIHRIRGLSRHYVYLNNDFMIARPVSFFDFFQPYVVYGSKGSDVPPAPPQVKWIPLLRTCAVRTYPNAKTYAKTGLSPMDVETIDAVSRMADTTVKFTFGLAHIPQMYDKLQVMRMVAEPSFRGTVCRTRGSRSRASHTFVAMQAYSFFAVLWRHGFGPKSGPRALDAFIHRSREAPFMDSMGRSRSTLWDFLANPGGALAPMSMQDATVIRGNALVSEVFAPLFETVAAAAGAQRNRTQLRVKLLPLNATSLYDVATGAAGFSPTTATESVQVFPYTPSYDHWLVGLYRSIRDPVVAMERSKGAFFGTGKDVAMLVAHRDTVARRKATNTALFVTENDDMPRGSQFPSSTGVFGRLPIFVIEQLCAYDAAAWGVAAEQHDAQLTGASADEGSVGGILMGRDNASLSIDGLATAVQLEANQRKNVRPLVGDGAQRYTAVRAHVAGKIALACAVHETITVLEAAALVTKQPIRNHSSSPSSALVPIPRRVVLNSSSSSSNNKCAYGLRVRFEGTASVDPSAPFRGAGDVSPSSQRHDCRAFPLPETERPPAYDVVGAGTLVDILRLAVGDCDTRESSTSPMHIPPWEIENC